MKKIFRGLLVISVLLVVFLIAGMMLPSAIQLQSKVNISSTAESAYALLADYRRMSTWLNWNITDPAIRYRFEGEQQGVGAIMHWQSAHDEIGKGAQKIIETDTNKSVKHIIAFNNMPRAYSLFEIVEKKDHIELSCRFEMQLGFNIPARIRALFLSDDIERDYCNSIEKLSILLEGASRQ